MNELFAIELHVVSQSGSDYTYTAYRMAHDAEALELEAGKIAATMCSPTEYCDTWHVRQATTQEIQRYETARELA